MHPLNEEIILIINSNKLEDRRARGYVESLDDYAVNLHEITETPLTATQLAKLSKDMKFKLEDLLDKTSQYYQKELEGKRFQVNELSEILASHPESLRTPIIQANNQTFFVDSSFSMINKALMINHSRTNSKNRK